MLIAKQRSVEDHAAAIEKILKHEKILVQLPEGLRWKSDEIVAALEDRGFEIIVSGGRCFGACDLPFKEAAAADAEAILHIGHRPFYVRTEGDVPVFYYDWPMSFEVDEAAVSRELQKIGENRIGVVSSVQYIEAAKSVAETAGRNGKAAIYGGYVLGCWSEPAKTLMQKGCEAILFVGSGYFHPLGFDCKYVFDLENNEIRDITEQQQKWERRKFARIAKAREAKSFGIIVSSKTGQKELLAKASAVKERLEKSNKKAFIVVMDEIRSDTLSEMRVDAFINTACPRIADDEWEKPVVNADEMDILLEEV